jgi:hypothetical protein
MSESFVKARGGTATSGLQQRIEKEKQEDARLMRSAGERKQPKSWLATSTSARRQATRACRLRASEAVTERDKSSTFTTQYHKAYN